MSESSKSHERRKFSRALLKTDIFYSDENAPDLKVEGNNEASCLVDLAEGGVGFVSGAELPKNAKLDVSFDLKFKDGETMTIQATGIVKYCFSQADYKTFRVGLEFIKIKGQAKQFIKKFIEELSA